MRRGAVRTRHALIYGESYRFRLGPIALPLVHFWPKERNHNGVRDGVVLINGLKDFFAKTEPWRYLDASRGLEFVQQGEILRFGHDHDELGTLLGDRQSQALAGQVLCDLAKRVRIRSRRPAIDIGHLA